MNVEDDKKPRIWLITGISSGLGQSLAEAVYQQGDLVVGTFRKQEQVDAFTASGKGTGLLLDLCDERSIYATAAKIKKDFGRLDVLVNNAGVGFAGAVEEASEEETRAIFEVNFFGTIQLTRCILPIMRQQRSGRIIQISSQAGIAAAPGFGIYNASKFALEGASEALAKELAPLGIQLTLVEPGPFRTNFAGGGLQLAAQEIADYAPTAGVFRSKLQSVHGKQEGDPDKAAKAILAISQMDETPLRQPLGKLALASIEQKIQSVQADLEYGRQLAEWAVFEK